ncbi:hypothetical protein EZS27_001249 [termite gut metagenome]|uniref:Uncharacterized protein n=1 Tax=termite gut metagenome TaxID=433724 RepID=A0A5J4T1V3_9ZZZZ
MIDLEKKVLRKARKNDFLMSVYIGFIKTRHLYTEEQAYNNLNNMLTLV